MVVLIKIVNSYLHLTLLDYCLMNPFSLDIDITQCSYFALFFNLKFFMNIILIPYLKSQIQ